MPSDQLLFDEMATAVRAYDAAQLTFREFLDRLESCVDRLNDEDVSWKEAFQREWGRMEDAYAYASFKGQRTIPEKDMPAVEFALKEVKRLIAEKAGKPL